MSDDSDAQPDVPDIDSASVAEQRRTLKSAEDEQRIAYKVVRAELADREVHRELEAEGLEVEAVGRALDTRSLMRAADDERDAFRKLNLDRLELEEGIGALRRRLRVLRFVAAGAVAFGAVVLVLIVTFVGPSPRPFLLSLLGAVLTVPLGLWALSERNGLQAARRRRALEALVYRAEHAYERALVEKGVREELRALRNRARTWSIDVLQRFNDGASLDEEGNVADATRSTARIERPLLRPLDSKGLAELSSNDWEVSTSALQRARNLLRTMPGGTIGVAGPRGAGKTTLLRSLYRENESIEGGDSEQRWQISGVSVMVTAPVAFEPREFVPMLFAGACNKVLYRRESGPPDVLDPQRGEAGYPPALGAISLLFPVVAGGFLGLAGLFAVLSPTLPSPSQIVGGVLLAIGYVLAFGGALRLRRQRRASIRAARDSGERLLQTAAANLRHLHFQRKATRGLKGALSMPKLGVGVEQSTSEEVAQRELTYPEIVSRLRSFLEDCAQARRETAAMFGIPGGARPGVIVAIDELDKLSSIDQARGFMDELKVLFGVADCFFLVSISEDAMASFETRGLPFRDVFDSSLDEVVTLQPLTLAESRRLLFRRVEGLDLTFIALLHCVSGGVPRDLIRHARSLVLLSKDATDGMTLGDVCAHIVREEMRDKGAGIIAAVRAAPFRQPPSRLLSFAERLRTANPTRATLRALRTDAQHPDITSSSAEGEDKSVQRLLRIARELDGFLAFLDALLEYFDDKLTAQRLIEGERAVDRCARIDHLAHARQAFGAGSGLALTMLAEWRDARKTSPAKLMKTSTNGRGHDIRQALQRLVRRPAPIARTGVGSRRRGLSPAS